ncbi:MAG TPA: transketolase C-terminal domain-containing protein [Vicinamibacterales bacterium]|nr:transketolase C-terminal domain-containing protein [Vicinamibacterales bacterium]
MRAAFRRTLVDLAANDPRIVLLTGDLGFTVLEPFAERFPARFFNVGVAEQDMIGIATGLAEAGYIPYVYSIATFAALRPYEFIRNGPVLHQLPVRIAGVGGGFEYGHAGPTHHGLEDIGVLRLQPGLTLVCPADWRQAAHAIIATSTVPGPVYYRLGKDDHTIVPGLDGRFRLGGVEIVKRGDDLLMLSSGAITVDAAGAARALAVGGIATTLAVVSSFNPSPDDDLARLLARFAVVTTIEAHYVTGGLGSLVAEIVAERGLRCRLVRVGVRDMPRGVSGSQGYLQQLHGISSASIVNTVRLALGQEVQ